MNLILPSYSNPVQCGKAIFPGEVLLLMAKIPEGFLRQFSTKAIVGDEQIQKVKRMRVRYVLAIFGSAPGATQKA